ncbi:hypothetical protein [Treponema sp. R80B11-R83G3]
MKKLLIVVLFCLLCTPLFAQVGMAGAKPESELASSVDIELLQTAYTLAKFGYNAKSSSALICAAEIIAQTQTQSLGSKGIAKDETGDADKKTGKPEYTVANLLADGKKFAAMNKKTKRTMLAWAASVKKTMKSKTKDAISGPKYLYDKVGADGQITYKLAFEANKLAEVLVCGDGDTDLDLYVFDQNNDLIVYDEGYFDDCYVKFVPKNTMNFNIVVKNRGACL